MHTPSGQAKGDYLVELLIADLTIAVQVALTDHLVDLSVGQFLPYGLRDPSK